MADLLEKIGRYFAAQELQTRQTYAAQYAANQQPNQIQQPRVSLVVRVPEQPQRPMKQVPPSLVRRRLPLPSEAAAPGHSNASASLPLQRTLATQKTGGTSIQNARRDLSWGQSFGSNQEDDADAVARWDASSYATSKPVQSRSTSSHSQSRDDEASVSSSRKPKRPSQRRKLKRKASVSSQRPRSLVEEARLAEQKAEKVAAALVLAQERARSIQLQEMQAQQAKQKARDAQRSKIQEQMRRIEAIRIKSKPPGTPQSSRPSSAPSSVTRSVPTRSGDEDADGSTDEEASAVSRIGFLKSMEDTLRRQMLVDLQIKQEFLQDQQRKQLEMVRLQAQTSRQRDRNYKQQQTIETLSQNKAFMEKELAQLLEQASAIATERRRIEESERQERIRRQNEAERRLSAQLHEEEWQRLVDLERISSENAAEARAKAYERVKSRAAAAKKPTPYCYRIRRPLSSRPSLSNSSSLDSGDSGSKMWFPAPEISEFEEDGLAEAAYEWDFEPAEEEEERSESDPMIENNAHSPVKIASFRWQIPEFASREQFDDLLLNDMLSSSDEDV